MIILCKAHSYGLLSSPSQSCATIYLLEITEIVSINPRYPSILGDFLKLGNTLWTPLDCRAAPELNSGLRLTAMTIVYSLDSRLRGNDKNKARMIEGGGGVIDGERKEKFVLHNMI